MSETHASGEYFHLPSLLLILIICLLPIVIILRSNQSHPHPKGCRRLGLPPGQSNLDDEFDPKYSQAIPSTSKDDDKPAWRIKALFTYPLKSCGGIELQTSEVVPTGLKYDRQFVFAEHTTEGWTCRTLRNAGYQRLALVRPEVWVPDPSAADYDPSLPEVQSQGVLVISYPRVIPAGYLGQLVETGMTLGLLDDRETFTIPLHPKETDFPLIPVKIWKDTPKAWDYGALLSDSIHRYLGSNPRSSKLTLLRANPTHKREIYRNAPRKEELGFQPTTSFADAYPIHLLNLASHQDVASKCAETLPNLTIRRFRANIITQGPGAFAEDHWKRILIGGVEVYAACRTVRCRLPNVDPLTGERHGVEPDRTLKSYRRIDEGDRTNACLGMQLVPAVEEFEVSVGDEAVVLETGEHRYIKMLAPGEKVEGV